jgi:hypothetical protein
MKNLVKESLNEQTNVEELIKHCEVHQIHIKGIVYEMIKVSDIEKYFKKIPSEWREAPGDLRGDMDSESWGDAPDWRPREMGQ